jgi:hypothetical protein
VALVEGGIVVGSIRTAIEKDQFTFEGAENQVIELIVTSAPLTEGFSAYAELYAPSGARVRGFMYGQNQRVILHESGVYMLQVRDDNYRETGTYRVGFESIAPPSHDAVPLSYEQTLYGTIGTAVEKDQFSYCTEGGEMVTLFLTGRSSLPGFVAYVEVFDPSGDLIQGFPYGQNRPITFHEAGVYTIQVRDDNYMERGVYTLSMSLPSPTNLNDLALASGVTLDQDLGWALSAMPDRPSASSDKKREAANAALLAWDAP